MSSKRVRALVVFCAAVPIAGSIGTVKLAKADDHAKAKHVLLISVDGMHQGDLAWYVENHPTSTLASLVRHGVEFLNAAWQATYPTAVQPLVAMSVNDDGMLIWLNDRSDRATGFARDFLLGYSKPAGDPKAGNDINGNSKGFSQAGLTTVLAGEDAADYFKVNTGDSRVPDIFGISQVGTVFTGGHGKIAEHGGANPQDRDVPLLVSGGPIGDHSVNDSSVETTQIAPTILQLLGLDSDALKAVQIEGTEALPLN